MIGGTNDTYLPVEAVKLSGLSGGRLVTGLNFPLWMSMASILFEHRRYHDRVAVENLADRLFRMADGRSEWRFFADRAMEFL